MNVCVYGVGKSLIKENEMGEIKNKDGATVGYFHDQETPQERDMRMFGKEAQMKSMFNSEVLPGQIPVKSIENSKVLITTGNSVPPTTPQELTEFAIDFFYDCIQVSKEKNARYAGPVDPFKNFRLGGTYGIAIRMTDKVSRLLTLLHPNNKIDSADETIEDTCKDLANYSMLLIGMRKNENETTQTKKG